MHLLIGLVGFAERAKHFLRNERHLAGVGQEVAVPVAEYSVVVVVPPVVRVHLPPRTTNHRRQVTRLVVAARRLLRLRRAHGVDKPCAARWRGKFARVPLKVLPRVRRQIGQIKTRLAFN